MNVLIPLTDTHKIVISVFGSFLKNFAVNKKYETLLRYST